MNKANCKKHPNALLACTCASCLAELKSPQIAGCEVQGSFIKPAGGEWITWIRMIEQLQAPLKNVRNFLVVLVNHEDICESCQEEVKILLEEID